MQKNHSGTFFSLASISSLLLCFLYFRIQDAIPILNPLGIPRLLGLLTFTLLAIHLFAGKKRFYWSQEMKWLLLFVGLSVVSALTALNRALGIAHVEALATTLLTLYGVILIFDRPGDLKFLFSLFMLSGLLLSGVIIQQLATGVPIDRVTVGKEFDSIIGDPNDLAGILILSLCISIGFIMLNHKSILNKILAFICFPFILFAIFATKSRGGLLGTIAIFIFFSYHKIKNKFLFLIVTIGIASLLLVVSGISSRHIATDDGSMDDSAMNRLYAWEAAVRMAIHHPLLGVGPANFQNHFFQFARVWLKADVVAHSTWFSVLGETGFLGFGLYMAFIITALKKIHRCTCELHNPQCPLSKDPDLLCFSVILYTSLIGTFVTCSFLSHQFSWDIYTLTALIIIINRFLERSMEEKNPT
jgi:O-antigen ligase